MSDRGSIHLSWRPSGPCPKTPQGEIVPALQSPGIAVVAGDNQAVLSALSETHRGKAALVYLDPPFFTGRQYRLVQRGRDPEGRPARTLSDGFDDRWDSLEQYLEALWPRLVAARELLREDGSLVLHVDPKTSHYSKLLLDELFGMDCFASELIWRYRRWPAKTANFQRVHDVLLRYQKNAAVSPIFNQLYEPLAASTQTTWGDRKQRAVFAEGGRRARSSSTSEASPGAPLGDVWEISIVAPVAKERTGYPTQKPEALIERLLLALTNPGDLVVDGYLGSGTTLAVAARLGRDAIGIDQNPAAIQVSLERLDRLGTKAAQSALLARPSLRKTGAVAAMTSPLAARSA